MQGSSASGASSAPRFLRSFTLPADADEKGVRADFKDGVLNVHVARSAAARPKAIEVKIG